MSNCSVVELCVYVGELRLCIAVLVVKLRLCIAVLRECMAMLVGELRLCLSLPGCSCSYTPCIAVL